MEDLDHDLAPLFSCIGDELPHLVAPCELAQGLGHRSAGLAAGGAAGTTVLEDDIRRLLDVRTRSFQATQTAASRSANVNSAQLLAR